MKPIYFIPILFIFSCTSTKLYNHNINTIPGLNGKVKSIEITSSRYEVNENGSSEILGLKTHSNIYLNANHKILKQIDDYQNYTVSNIFNYRGALLVNVKSKFPKKNDKTEYEYDKKENLIQVKDFQSDTLWFLRTYKYDSHNNPIEIKSTFYRANKISSKDIYVYKYDYKNKTVISYDPTEKDRGYGHFKQYYDKKGLEIKGESINADNTISNSVLYEYDKSGNLTKQTNLDKDNNPTQIIYHVYTYDKKGNVIKNLEYIKDQIISKASMEITYW